jgi:hypothetical protein
MELEGADAASRFTPCQCSVSAFSLSPMTKQKLQDPNRATTRPPGTRTVVATKQGFSCVRLRSQILQLVHGGAPPPPSPSMPLGLSFLVTTAGPGFSIFDPGCRSEPAAPQWAPTIFTGVSDTAVGDEPAGFLAETRWKSGLRDPPHIIGTYKQALAEHHTRRRQKLSRRLDTMGSEYEPWPSFTRPAKEGFCRVASRPPPNDQFAERVRPCVTAHLRSGRHRRRSK